jgi:hypothetical protein
MKLEFYKWSEYLKTAIIDNNKPLFDFYSVY